MNSRLSHYLATHPGAHMKYITTGKLPQGIRPNSPLITLIQSIPRREWQRYNSIRLSPALGYNINARFTTLHKLYKWLMPNGAIIGRGYYHAGSCQIKSFRVKLKPEDLKDATFLHRAVLDE